jgi:N-acetylglucosaminyl-diphospho-decaprenol L-rhamnosyltransferase
MLPSLDIVIVNWNSAHQLRECLDSIVSSDRDDFILAGAIVVDNASTDRSLDGLESLDLPLTIIRNSENKGFGVACNQGAAIRNSDYILFLNPDTRLFKEAIDKAVSFIKNSADEKIGVVGIQLVDSQGKIQRNCARFPSPLNFWCSILGIDKVIKNRFTSYLMTEWNHETTQAVDHVIGAFYLIGSDIFRSVGGFDESFFVYFEDLDLSYRLNQQGFSSYYLADVRSFHKGGGTSESIKATRIFYSLRSRILYVYKHFNSIQATTILLASLLIEPVTRIIFSVLRLSLSQAQETISAYIQLFTNYRDISKLIQKKSHR